MLLLQIPICEMILSLQEVIMRNDFFVSSEPLGRNTYFNAVENVNHEKLDESC